MRVFPVLTEPSSFALLLRAGDDSSTRRWRGVSQAPRVCALGLLYTRLGRPPHRHTQPGPSAEATPRRRRAATRPHDGIGRVGVLDQSTWALGSATPESDVPLVPISRGHTRCDARRRRRAPAEDSSRRRRRALPRAGDGCCRLVVSVTEAEAMALLADNETAQELQHGCGDDCWRSASLAALHARPRALH